MALPQIQFQFMVINWGKLGFPSNVYSKFRIDISLVKKSDTFFIPFHLCFPIIATSIFHLWAIKITLTHYIWHWRTCYSYLVYISIPKYISQFNTLLMNQIKFKWFGSSTDTLTYYPCNNIMSRSGLVTLAPCSGSCSETHHNILAMWFVITSKFQKTSLPAQWHYFLRGFLLC